MAWFFWTIVVSTTILLSIYSVRKQNKQTNKKCCLWQHNDLSNTLLLYIIKSNYKIWRKNKKINMSYKKSLLFNSCSDKSKNIFDSYEWSLIIPILFLDILDRIAGSAIARAALRCLVFFGLIDTISSWYIGQKSHFSNICNFPGSETSRSINEPKSKKKVGN